MERIKDNSYGATPIFKESDQYLILLVKHRAGHWTFPKGHPESGESKFDTIKRELQEEIGIKDFDLDENTDFVEHYSFESGNKLYDKENAYYPAFVHNKTINTPEKFKKEIPECRWLTSDEALKLAQFDSTKEIIRQVEEYLGRGGKKSI